MPGRTPHDVLLKQPTEGYDDFCFELVSWDNDVRCLYEQESFPDITSLSDLRHFDSLQMLPQVELTISSDTPSVDTDSLSQREAVLQQHRTALMAGSSDADLYLLTGGTSQFNELNGGALVQDVNSLMAGGVLANLSELLDEIDRSEYLNGVFEAGQLNGAQYLIPLRVELNGIIVDLSDDPVFPEDQEAFLQTLMETYARELTGASLGCAFVVGTLSYPVVNKAELTISLYDDNYTAALQWAQEFRALALDIVVVGCQILVSCLSGFAFAKFTFRWKRGLFFLMIVLMMLPVQATLVPNYIILDRLRLLNTWAALALPCIFLPFGTVLMTQAFRRVPDEVLDAARMDGANAWQTLWQVLVPASRGGVISLILLTFVDVWNMVEQPMVFLQDAADYPLSVFLAVVNRTDLPLSFAGGLLSMLPTLLLLLYFRDELTEGVTFTGVN